MTRLVFILLATLTTATCFHALDLHSASAMASAPIESENSEEGAEETFSEFVTLAPHATLSMVAFDLPSPWPTRELCAPSPILDPLVDPPRA